MDTQLRILNNVTYNAFASSPILTLFTWMSTGVDSYNHKHVTSLVKVATINSIQS